MINRETLLQAVQRTPGFAALKETLTNGQPVFDLGLLRAARLPLLAALQRERKKPLLLVVERADHALQAYEELAFWFPQGQRLLFREPTPRFYERSPWDDAVRRDRLQVLTMLAAWHLPFGPPPDEPLIIVASLRAFMTRTMPRRTFLRAMRRLRVGDRFALEKLAHEWLRLGYQPVTQVVAPGQLARRGGLLDLWPPADDYPLRLDFFGDELETLRRFDPASQRTVAKVDQAWVGPAREFLLPPQALQQPPSDQPAEWELPKLHPDAVSLLAYLPEGSLVALDDRSWLAAAAEEIETQAVRLRHEQALPTTEPAPYFTWSELEDRLHGRPQLELGGSGETLPSLRAAFLPAERFGGRLKPLMTWLQVRWQENEQVLILSRQAERLRAVWARQPQPTAAPGQPPQFSEGVLSAGFQLHLPEGERWHLLTDAEIFGWQRPQPRGRRQPPAEAPETPYADLRPGDYVVHVDHGIGQFVGLVQRSLAGKRQEFLTIAYRDGDQLFVPVHQADRLTRYIGPDGRPPQVGRLGGGDWQHTRRRVQAAVRQTAAELLDLYARRQAARGHAFSPDTDWQRTLEDAFPYIETEDQKRVLAEIKRDMEAPRPMDRLLCGDVGYGKTEIALRAAFKAVMDGKQVVMLTPTTVLAQQHYDTFRQRLAVFPLRVEMLSRFRSASEQSRILHELANGQIDIIIGTHRLLQPDVQFHDLGLAIIDEEQRFGVAHKEHFKRLRTAIDVLTLTATPIPRTLYMALTGVRDISMLATAPEERLPVAVHVGPYDPQQVRQAILREMERGGQVFFVHNRVQTIAAMRAHLQHLVPTARIAVAHGQMPEKQLAAVMRRFAAGEIDVLLSTTIIESGLDIPNANTLIVDRADTFGLAQLYQLRGRVGRGAVRAYAYFFRHPRKKPSPEGRERLEVIAENTQLGAGYAIAMRDLEIRGAGDLLGTRQHGHIAAVGFHLYTRLLADAVRQLRAAHAGALPGAESLPALPLAVPVNVDLPLSAGIPPAYIADADLRLQLYRRLADARSPIELDALAEEFADRFGPLPAELQALFYQMQVKLLAERAGLASIAWEPGTIVLRYARPAARPYPDLAPDVQGGREGYRCRFASRPDWQARLLETLHTLAERKP